MKFRKYEPPLAHKATCEYRDSNGARACTCSRKPGCSRCHEDLVHDYCKDAPNMSYLACCPSENEAWQAIDEAAKKLLGTNIITGSNVYFCPCGCGKKIYESTITLRQVREC